MPILEINGTKWGTSLSRGTPIDSIQIIGGWTQFTLRRGGLGEETFRSELSGRDDGLTRQMLSNVEYLVRFNLHTPPVWRPDDTHEIIWQLHKVPDDEERGEQNQPLLSLRVHGRQLCMHYGYSTAPISYAKNNLALGQSREFGRLGSNKKYPIELRFNLSRGTLGKGFFDVSLDGRREFSYSGPLGYDDEIGPYMKFGIYKSRWNPKQGRGPTRTDVRQYGFSGLSVIRVDQPFGVVSALQEDEK